MDINMQNLMGAISTAKNMAVEGGGDGNAGVPAGQDAPLAPAAAPLALAVAPLAPAAAPLALAAAPCVSY